ncbi:hypothetical protein [Desulfurobacterium sp.]|uniref:hypothetical protein n=1 Tax=Desulfurobacterium sp. TaxID=2004706 RepID=UPI00260ADA37|nr:hypothetical protein [Desulfurobacterium sp.]
MVGYDRFANYKRVPLVMVSLRIYPEDLDALKKLAEKDGLPYQTLMRSVLHKYVNSRRHELEEIERERAGR